MTYDFHPMDLPAGYRMEKVVVESAGKRRTAKEKRDSLRVTLYGPDGRFVSEHPNMDAAITKAERHERESRMKARPCISCKTEFMSEGAHHRMCTNCRLSPRRDDLI